jgi:hypothetical protein
LDFQILLQKNRDMPYSSKAANSSSSGCTHYNEHSKERRGLVERAPAAKEQQPLRLSQAASAILRLPNRLAD